MELWLQKDFVQREVVIRDVQTEKRVWVAQRESERKWREERWRSGWWRKIALDSTSASFKYALDPLCHRMHGASTCWGPRVWVQWSREDSSARIIILLWSVEAGSLKYPAPVLFENKRKWFSNPTMNRPLHFVMLWGNCERSIIESTRYRCSTCWTALEPLNYQGFRGTSADRLGTSHWCRICTVLKRNHRNISVSAPLYKCDGSPCLLILEGIARSIKSHRWTFCVSDMQKIACTFLSPNASRSM